jgi:hypothetical protein
MKRKSLLTTANQPFSGRNDVFPDPGMTIAAIDRLVHHSTIFELNVESYRRRKASDKQNVRRRAVPNDNQKGATTTATYPATTTRRPAKIVSLTGWPSCLTSSTQASSCRLWIAQSHSSYPRPLAASGQSPVGRRTRKARHVVCQPDLYRGRLDLQGAGAGIVA